VKVVLLLAALLAALAVLLGFVLTRDGDEADFRGSQPPEGLTMPEFNVELDDASFLRSDELRDRAVAVTFLDTQCTEACPIAATQIAEALRLLGDERDRVVALAFSVDPEHDTVRSIRAFLSRSRAYGLIRYVDAPVENLRPVWSAFQIQPSVETGNSNLHSVPVRVYDTEGRWRSTLHPGVDLTAANLAHDLELALDA
jgi:cytochrome oxidase Cu insertion factor (SCO1/SenC/PrrC family)